LNGHVSYFAGLAAEDSVAALYENHGYQLRAKRWRCEAGEIDLIVQQDACLVFVEVKKSRSLAQAAQRLSQAQQRRIMKAASTFLADQPNGQDTDCRFDVALVSGRGTIQILDNIPFDV
jgi:putative endonuclease